MSDVLLQFALGALVACASGYAGSWLRAFVASHAEQYPEADDQQLVEMRANAASEARRDARRGDHFGAASERRLVRRYDRALARRGIHHT